MYEGFLELGGTELCNAERTAAYIRHVMPEFPFRHVWPAPDLVVALQDERYNSPLVDDAEWVSAADPATHGFFGLYPISVEGIGDSTVRASVTEHIVDGGSVGPARAASRTIRVRGMLLGRDERSAEAGLTWLRNALDPRSCDCTCPACQGADLRYFLAPPTACDPAWDSYDGAGDTVDLGTVDPASSPLIYQFPVHETMPSRAWWQLPAADGVIVRWGALERGGSRILEEHGPIHLLRSNHIPNPRLRGADAPATVLPAWTLSAGDTVESWAGDEWTRVSQTAMPTIITNWLPDPSFENGTPTSRGWRSSTPGGITAVADGTASSPTVAVVPAVAGQTQLEVTMLGPAIQETIEGGKLAFDVAQNADDIVVDVLDNLGVLLETHTIAAAALTAPWQRVVVDLDNIAINYTLRLSTAGTDELRVDRFALVQSATTTFFDGSTAGGGGVTYSFVGANASSASRMVDTSVNGFSETSLTAITDAPGGEGVVSVYLATPETTAQVTVDVLDADSNVLASTTVTPPAAGQRYFIPVIEARQARVQLRSSGGEYLVGRVMLEAGAQVGDYFDGDSAAPADYAVTWDALPEQSVSRMTWTGSTQITRSDSNWRPILWVDQGILRHVLLSYAIRQEIPMDTQLEPVERRYHSVKAISGPTILRRHSLDPGAAIDVEFLLVAEKPYPFANPRTIFTNLMEADSVFYADEVVNYLTNPSGRASTTGYVILGAGSTLSQSVGNYTQNAFTSAIAAGNAGIRLQQFNVGVDLEPNTTYILAMDVWGTVDVGITASGTGVASTGANPAPVPPNTWQRVYRTFTTGAAGTVSVYVINRAATVNGTQIRFRDATVTFGDAQVPYFDGSTADTVAYDYAWDGPANGSTSRRTIHVDVVDPLIDPDLPPLPEPPEPPQIPDLAIEPIYEWRRFYIPIDAEDVATWAVSVPVVQLTTQDAAIRQVRVQYLPNPFGRAPEQIDPTTFCGEYLLSYLPPESTLTITGVTESAWAEVAQRPQVPADHLLYASDGGPVIWPELTCGVAYVMAVDVPPDLDVDDIDFDLLLYRRE